MIYFDHNAATPLDERVLEAMLPYLKGMYGNPSSLYRFGRIARTAVETAREQVAALAGAEPGQIVFTSGGTEANALALANCRSQNFAISAIEHPSVFENAQALPNPPQILKVEQTGLIMLETMVALNLQAGDFLSVMLANNETGVIQNIGEIAEYCRQRGIIMHSDAVQAAGKIPLSFRQLGVQMLSLSSHKIYGPKGCGALVAEQPQQLRPLLRGGGQEAGLRAGTENVAAIAGFGKAAELAKSELETRFAQLQALRDKLTDQLIKIPGLEIFSLAAPRLPNTVQFGVSGVKGEMLLMQLDKHGVAVSSGSACAMGSHAVSPVLQAMSVQPDLARSAIRVSLGKDNNEQELDEFVQILRKLLNLN